MTDSDDGLLADFIVEAMAGLDRIEQLLLQLEQQGASQDMLDDLFRCLHSIKGNASFLELGSLVELAHAGETLMGRVRTGQQVLDASLADLLLATVDRIKEMISASDLGQGQPATDLLARYEGFIADGAVGSSPEDALDAAPSTALEPPAPQPAPKPAPKPVSGPPSAAEARPVEAVATMRVPVQFLDDLLSLTGTMVMARNQLLSGHQFHDDVAFSTLSRCIAEVHKSVVQSRMVPVSELFTRFHRVVRDLARRLGKEVELQVDGGEIELDRTILEAFSDPLTHLVRNALDHALETPEERMAADKHRCGRLALRAYQQSGEIIIEVEDDGRGIDDQVVRAKAVDKGILDAAAAGALSRKQALNLIMQAGFSTRDQATDVSGRGVGMDVVRTNIEAIGGSIGIHTEVGSGTVFAFRLPVTQAIVSSSLISALVVVIGNERYAIPESAVNEIIRIDPQDPADRIRPLEGQGVFQLRNKVLSIVHPEDAFGQERTFIHPVSGAVLPDRRQRVADRRGEESAADAARWAGRRSGQERRRSRQTLVVVEFRRSLFGLMIDRVAGIEEIVVRPTPALVAGSTVFSGHTVLGDGVIVLLLDVPGLVQRLGLHFDDDEDGDEVRSYRALRTGQQMVLFNGAPQEYFALPLMMISLIEKIEASAIRRVGSREFFQLKQETIPLLRLDQHLDVSPLAPADTYHLLLPAHVNHPIGILAGHDLHIVDVAESFDGRVENDRGMIGTFVHDDRLVMLLDVYGLFAAADPEHYRQDQRALGSRRRILLAEDTHFFCKLMQQYLDHPEIDLTVVYDGKQAWDLLQDPQAGFDLVLSDIEMPVMNGFELVRNIKGHPQLRSLPVIALTSLSDEESRRRGMKAGFDEYAVKIDKDSLLEMLFDILFQGRRS